MSEPFTPAMICRSLKHMPIEVLRVLDPHKFHLHPVRKIVPVKVIRELIDNELSSRGPL